MFLDSAFEKETNAPKANFTPFQIGFLIFMVRFHQALMLILVYIVLFLINSQTKIIP
jgi:hypothetical protein